MKGREFLDPVSSSPSSQTNSSIDDQSDDLDVGLKVTTSSNPRTNVNSGDSFPPPPPVPPKLTMRQSSSSSSINGSSSSLSSASSGNQSHTLTRDSGNSSFGCTNSSQMKSCCQNNDQVVHATCVHVQSSSRRPSQESRRPSQDSRRPSQDSRRPSQESGHFSRSDSGADQCPPPLPPKTIPPPLPPKTFKKQSSSGLLGISQTLRPMSGNQRRSSAITGSVHSDPRSSTLCSSLSTGKNGFIFSINYTFINQINKRVEKDEFQLTTF